MNPDNNKWLEMGIISDLDERDVEVNAGDADTQLIAKSAFKIIFTELRGNQETMRSTEVNGQHIITLSNVLLTPDSKRYFYVIYDSEILTQAFTGPSMYLEAVLVSSDDLNNLSTNDISLMLAGRPTGVTVKREMVIQFDVHGFQIVNSQEQFYKHSENEVITSPYDAITLFKQANDAPDSPEWMLRQVKQGQVENIQYI